MALDVVEATVAPPALPVVDVLTAALARLLVLLRREVACGRREPRLHRLEAGGERVSDGDEPALLRQPEGQGHADEIARGVGRGSRPGAGFDERFVAPLDVEPGIEPILKDGVGGVAQARREE